MALDVPDAFDLCPFCRMQFCDTADYNLRYEKYSRRFGALVLSMRMLALPIARRELLVLSRAWGTWKNRIGVSVMVLGAGILLSGLYHYGGQMAITFAMHFVGSTIALMCLFTGVTLTADSIAEEKRNGTLGLLFLTHLSPFEIVLGKLVAHAVAGFYTALCALPLLSMSMIFGGMRFRDVLMYMLSALNVLFFSSALGLLASSICKDRRRAASLGTMIVLFFWMGLPMLVLFLSWVGAQSWVLEWIMRLSLNMFQPFGAGMPKFLPSTLSPAWSFLSPQIWGWAFLGLAIWMLPRRWQDEPPKKRWVLRDLWTAISLGTPATRLKLRRKLLDRNAFMWLASRDRLQTLGMWIGTGVVITFFGITMLRTKAPELLIIMSLALSAVQQLAFSGAAAVQLVREYEQGTLELILSTPFSVQEVIRGQLAAARRRFRSAFAFTFVLLWAALVFMVLKGGLVKWRGIGTIVVYSGFFLLQFYAMPWVAAWGVAMAPDPKRANAVAFFYLLMLPGIMFGMILAAWEFLNWLFGFSYWPEPAVILTLLFTLAFSNTIYWLRRARRELPERLRVFAFRRYMPVERHTFFGQIGKLLGRLWGRMQMRRLEPRITR
jgi:ABC-type Na+ efflux pump permease subunit